MTFLEAMQTGTDVRFGVGLSVFGNFPVAEHRADSEAWCSTLDRLIFSALGI